MTKVNNYLKAIMFFSLVSATCSPTEQKPQTIAVIDEKPAQMVFSTELEKMNHFHPVDWDRFGNSIEVLNLERFRDKSCVKLQQQFDQFSNPRVYQNYTRATGKAPDDVLDWLDHALYSSGCYKGQYSSHSKE